MPSSRHFLCLAVLLLSISSAIAGAPALEGSCQDRDGRRVLTLYNTARQYFAQAELARASERSAAAQRGLSQFVIYVNPSLYFLGRQTQQWLFYRQCAHIVQGHPIARSGVRALNIRDEEQADCWAARRMGTSPRTLYSIERDMERLLREKNRWSRVLPGPQRRIALSSCMKK